MAAKALEIHLLSASGESLRKIRCLPGRISVFRAHRDRELDLYTKAIAGLYTSERFSVLVDESPFNRDEHVLIGFGESFAAESTTATVAEYLTAAGAKAATIPAVLLKFGLGGLEERLCKELSAGEEQTLRILTGACNPKKIIVLNDPFSAIAAQWREKIAKFLTDHVAKRGAIVVVTRLTQRPDAWVENEYITRIQLERPRKPTIGIGGDWAQDKELIEKIRQEMAASGETQPVTFTPISPTRSDGAKEEHGILTSVSTLKGIQPGFLQQIIGGLQGANFGRTMLLACILVLGIAFLYQNKQEQVMMLPVDVSNNTTSVNQNANQVVPAGEKPPGNVEKKPVELHPLLDDYPEDIRQAVKLALIDPKKLFKPEDLIKGDAPSSDPKLESLLRALKDDKPNPDDSGFDASAN